MPSLQRHRTATYRHPFRAAIAGVLEHLPAASLMLNPTINSYRRLISGWFAPVNISWGLENRSCAVRAVRGEHRECRRMESARLWLMVIRTRVDTKLRGEKNPGRTATEESRNDC